MSISREHGGRPRNARPNSGSSGRRRMRRGWRRAPGNPASRCCAQPPRSSRSPGSFATPPRAKRRPAEERRDEIDGSREHRLDPRRLREGPGAGVASGPRPLAPGGYYRRGAPRLKDGAGRRLAGTGARFAFHAAPPPPAVRLLTPPAGGEVPWNVGVVRAFAERGRVALLGPGREELVSADARGPVALRLPAPLSAGAEYSLALDGAAAPGPAFTAARCARNAAPALQAGAAQLFVRDTGVTATLVLDWPVQIELTIEDARGAAVTSAAEILCAPPACGPQSFACTGSVRIEGLRPGSDYTLFVTARDDFGFVLRAAPQRFSTIAPLPRAIISEVMASGIDGEYVELLNLGPGTADLEALGLQGSDGIVRPLLGGAPPLPALLEPGVRALAVGASFDPSIYAATIPPDTPILRASTQRLLGRGLSDDAPPVFRLVTLAAVPVELADFPGGNGHCAPGASLQRDEAVPPGSRAAWACGRTAGTPGRPP